MASKQKIVVIGAGVSGLTTALELARTGQYDVAVLAKHMPGDFDIEYASPWAGADYLPVSRKGTEEERYDRETWPVLEKLAREVPEAGVHFQDCVDLRKESVKLVEEKQDTSGVKKWMAELLGPEGPWWSEMLPNYRHLTPAEAAPYDSGIKFTTVVLNVSLYLPWLASQALKHGVTLRRAELAHLLEARSAHPSGQPADLIVNATGLSSSKLPGVADPSVYPARGQVVLVRNEPNIVSGSSGTDYGNNEVCYIMQRAAGGGTILGGCYQKNDWNGEVDLELSQRIMQRAVEICPELTDEKSMPAGKGWRANQGVESLSVIRHAVGLRPVRDAGVRIEVERIKGQIGEGQEEETLVVHNYGHGGFGYQSSYGCAFKVVRLVEEALKA